MWRLTVIDPACGTGRFLLAAADRIARRIVEFTDANDPSRSDSEFEAALARARFMALGRCTFGIEIDPIVVEAARWRSAREAMKAGIECHAIREIVSCADALSSGEADRYATSRDAGFPGFDVVVGNPPWTSFSGRHRGEGDRAAVRRLVERFPAVARWPALHSATLLRASELVGEGGRVGLLLPLRVADLDVYEPVRRKTTRRLRLAAPVTDWGESAFADVTQPAGLFVFVASAGEDRGSGTAWPIDPARRSSYDRRNSQPNIAPSNVSPSDLAAVADALASLDGRPTFPPRTFSDPGVHTGNVAGKLLRDGQANGDDVAPIREGRDVVAYACLAPRKALRTTFVPADREYFRVGHERYLETPILLRQTADRPIAALHVAPAFFRNSLLACRGLDEIPHAATAAALNSALFAAMHRRLSADSSQRAFPQVKVGALHRLPRLSVESLGRKIRGQMLVDRLVEAAADAESEASSGGAVSEATLERIERLVLRSFDLPESLAPTLLLLVVSPRSQRDAGVRQG